ncbi:uncharacterized protein CTRU02_205964 [Colletotrichum truncatum]|uniref:Uncharacterized protein n=1 Tax=Colletotrichum truncatum TaxID=5467 RepID=A0ACC3Z5I9_COLTU|nr:uncharacterized protein CTRU02_04796 [Colletotrichum truncatum]KAF6795233.1 hypothetical protein CTRU02_04796 [Colletotrichum truncatum]
MSGLEPEPERSNGPGTSSGPSALDDALRSELYAAIEAVYASPPRFGPQPDLKPRPATTTRDPAHAPYHSVPRMSNGSACGRLARHMETWKSRLNAYDPRHQRAFYHLHPPENSDDLESLVMGQSMSAADSELVQHLRFSCPKSGFEVFLVVLEYTGITYQFNAWVPRQQARGQSIQGQLGEDGYWKTYQHVQHSPHIHQVRNLSGAIMAEEIDCREDDVLDKRNVAWERARRGIFSWQGRSEQRAFEEEWQARRNNPNWREMIVPGTRVDLGKYYAPAIMIVPLETQLHFINLAGKPPPVINVWRYLLQQCERSFDVLTMFDKYVPPGTQYLKPDKQETYTKALKALCNYAFPGGDDAVAETNILSMWIQNRKAWAEAIDSELLGDLMMTSLIFDDDEFFEHLATCVPFHPVINYIWLSRKRGTYVYPVGLAHKAYLHLSQRVNKSGTGDRLCRLAFQDVNFLQIANDISTIPMLRDDGEAIDISRELVQAAVTARLETPLSANHGRAIVELLRLCGNFQSWSEIVDSAIDQPRELWRHTQFILGLLNRLLEVTVRENLPLDQVIAFYRKFEKLVITTDSTGQVGSLVSNALKDQSSEAQIARQAWCEPEPTIDYLENKDVPPPTSFAVLAGLFRSLDQLGLREETANLVEHIIARQDEIKPIHMATLWLPCLRALQDLVDPETSAYQKLFQAIFERYENTVFEDVSGSFEDAPEHIPPMAPCCDDCKYLDAFLEQPNWKRFHVVKPRTVIDHIQDQLRSQKKAVEVNIFGKNEQALTMQLNKVSMVNKQLQKAQELRKQEATRIAQQFDPEGLLPFLGDKGDILWRLGNAESQENAPGKTPSKPSNTSAGSAVTPKKDPSDSTVKKEAASSIDYSTNRVTPKTESPSKRHAVKTEATILTSSERPVDGNHTHDMPGSVKKEAIPSSSQAQPRATGVSTRDRLKSLQPPRRNSTPKFNDYSSVPKDRTDRTHGNFLSSAGGPESSSSKTLEPATRRDPLASFGGIRSRGPVRTGTQTAGSAKGHTAPTMKGFGLSGRTNATPGPSTTSTQLGFTPGVSSTRPHPTSNYNTSSTSTESPRTTGQGGLSIFDAERAKGARSSGSAPGSQGASGNAAPETWPSARDKENTHHIGLSKPVSGRLSMTPSSEVLAARSPNVRPVNRSSALTAGSKRKAEDDAIIDLCGSSPELGPSKRVRRTAVFDAPDDDDPFAD